MSRVMKWIGAAAMVAGAWWLLATSWLGATAPRLPDVAHGRVYPMHADHRRIVYVTRREHLVASRVIFEAVFFIVFLTQGVVAWDRRRRGIEDQPRPAAPLNSRGLPRGWRDR
jgi:hypothetical protein